MNAIKNKFFDIKKSTLELDNSIKNKSLELTNSIITDEDKLKKLTNEKILFDKYKTESDIIENQKLLIDEYIINNNILKSKLLELEKTNDELNISQEKIKFYQEDNIRLSGQMHDIQKKYETIKINYNKAEEEKNDIFKKIKELNNSLLKNNIIGTTFLEQKVKEDNINSKVLNDIAEVNLSRDEISDADLNTKVNDIFK